VSPATSAASKPRGAVNDHELRAPQAPGIQTGEELAPGCRAFAAHVPDGQQHLLPVAPHPDRRQHRDVGGLAVQPGLDHGAIKDQADDVLIGQIAGGSGVPVDLHLAAQARLTTSLLTAPSNSPNSARLARRVLVPAR
jgi:hypothetical protein